MRSRIKYESFLADEIETYLEYRKKVGFKCGKLRWFFSTFDKYLQREKADLDDLTPPLLLAFRDNLDVDPGTVNKIFILLKGFFDYLVRMDVMAENPALDIPRVTDRAYIPYVISPEKLERFLKAAQRNVRKKDKYDFLKNLAVYTAIMLMGRCGLRISEPGRLKCDDYRPDERTLYIEKTKFNKDRLIPVPRKAVEELENYLSVRNSILAGNGNDRLLATKELTGVANSQIYSAFHRAARNVGLNEPSRIVGNVTFGNFRPHALRHTFAVNALKAVKERGHSPQNALPILAAYLGHADYRYTMNYLKVVDSEHRRALVDFCVHRGKRRRL